MYVSSRVTTTAASLDATATSGARRADPTPPAPRGAEATSTRVSGPGQLMSKLSQLRDSDPGRFSQAVSGMAADLRDVAARDSGMGATMLTALASRLEGIASGSPLEQPEPTVSRSAAAQAYRTSASLGSVGTDGVRGAIAKVLDDLDAALKKTTVGS